MLVEHLRDGHEAGTGVGLTREDQQQQQKKKAAVAAVTTNNKSKRRGLCW
jgi:hypothetical protein